MKVINMLTGRSVSAVQVRETSCYVWLQFERMGNAAVTMKFSKRTKKACDDQFLLFVA